MSKPFEREFDPRTSLLTERELSANLPKGETSVFSRPDYPDYADVVSSFLSSPKAQRRGVIQTARVSLTNGDYGRYHNFFPYYAEVRADIESRRYGNVDTSRMADLDSLAEALKPVRAAKSILPQSRTRLPQSALDLANECLREAFPSLFGVRIPELIQRDIIVADPAQMRRFMLTSDMHSLNRLAVGNLYHSGPLKTNEPLGADFFTETTTSERRVVIDSTSVLETPASSLTTMAARWLMHESMHRGTTKKRIEVAPNDLLLHAAYASFWYNIDAATSPQEKEDEEKFLGFAHNLVVQNGGAAVQIEGANLALYVFDDLADDIKPVGSSGYDINEAIAEYLLVPAVDILARIVASQMKNPDSQIPVMMAIKRTIGQTSSVKRAKLNHIVAGYLESIGLADRNKAMEAYLDGEIPDKHISNLPQQRYYH